MWRTVRFSRPEFFFSLLLFWGLFLHLALGFQSRSIRSLHNKDVFLHNVINDHVSHQRLIFLGSVSLAISRLPSIVGDSSRAGLEGRVCFFLPWNETEQVNVAWLLGLLGPAAALLFASWFISICGGSGILGNECIRRLSWDSRLSHTRHGSAPFFFIHNWFLRFSSRLLVRSDPETIIGLSVSSHLAIRYFALLVFSYGLIFAFLAVWLFKRWPRRLHACNLSRLLFFLASPDGG